jgi:predicted nucleotidyltransferase
LPVDVGRFNLGFPDPDADPPPGATLFDLGGLQDLPGVPVDLLTPGDLPPKFRGRVLGEAMPV